MPAIDVTAPNGRVYRLNTPEGAKTVRLTRIHMEEDTGKNIHDAHGDASLVDFNRVVVIQERLVERQQVLAEARGQIALGLIQVYRALGGGWQL